MSRPTTLQVLLFDVMDTLVRDPFPTVIPAFFGMTLDELLRQKHPTAWIEFERGELSPDQYYRRMFSDGRSFDTASFERAVRKAYAWVDGAETLLQELRQADVPMHAFSNYPVWYRMLDAELGLSRYLDWTFVSCKTGLRKPEPASYRHVAERLDFPPSECLFIDDRERNCAGARAFGFSTVRFENVPSLRAQLAERGILG